MSRMRAVRKQKSKAARKEDPRIAPVIEAIAAAAAVLDGEAKALEAGAVTSVAEWTERKRQAEAAVRDAAAAAAGQGLSISPGSPEAAALEQALSSFRAAADANSLALKGASMAVGQVLSVLKKVSVQDSSEGMYSRTAAMVAPAPRRGFGTAV